MSWRFILPFTVNVIGKEPFASMYPVKSSPANCLKSTASSKPFASISKIGSFLFESIVPFTVTIEPLLISNSVGSIVIFEPSICTFKWLSKIVEFDFNRLIFNPLFKMSILEVVLLTSISTSASLFVILKVSLFTTKFVSLNFSLPIACFNSPLIVVSTIEFQRSFID